jgi:hypothetical protein
LLLYLLNFHFFKDELCGLAQGQYFSKPAVTSLPNHLIPFSFSSYLEVFIFSLHLRPLAVYASLSTGYKFIHALDFSPATMVGSWLLNSLWLVTSIPDFQLRPLHLTLGYSPRCFSWLINPTSCFTWSICPCLIIILYIFISY